MEVSAPKTPVSPTRTPSSTPQKAKSRRARNLLRNYYGIQEESGGTVATGAGGSDAFNVNGRGFNAEQARNKYLRREGVAGLLRLDNKLISDIRELDGDSKTLVYENYDKFIHATETINHMKVGFSEMLASLQNLGVTLGETAKGQEEMVDGLAERRNKLRQLHGEHDRLSKLANILSLPSKLNELIGKGDITGAVGAYVRARPSLQEHEGLPGMEKISKESAEIVGQVERELLASLAQRDATMEEMTRGLGLCCGLSQDPHSLLHTFLRQAQQCLDKVARQTHVELGALPSMSHPPEGVEEGGLEVKGTGHDKVEHVNEAFLPLVSRGVSCLRACFLEEGEGEHSEWFPISPCKAETMVQMKKEIADFTEHWTKVYLALLKDCLSISEDVFSMDAAQAVHVLSKAYEGLKRTHDGGRPLWDSDEMVRILYGECVGAWESAYVGAIFQRIYADFEGQCAGLLWEEGGVTDLYDFVVQEETRLTDALAVEGLSRLEGFLQSGMRYVEEEEGAAEQFRGIVRAGLRSFWGKVELLMREVGGGGRRGRGCTAQGILVLSNFAMDFESAAVMATAEAFSQGLCPRVARIGERGWWSEEDRSAWEVWEGDVRVLMGGFGEVAQILLQRYVERVSGKVIRSYRTSLLRGDMEKMGRGDVRGPSVRPWREGMEVVRGAEREVIVLFGNEAELEGMGVENVGGGYSDGEEELEEDFQEDEDEFDDGEVSETQSVTSRYSAVSKHSTRSRRETRLEVGSGAGGGGGARSRAQSTVSKGSMTSRRRLRGLTSPTQLSHGSPPSMGGYGVPPVPSPLVSGGVDTQKDAPWLQPLGRLFMKRVEVFPGEVEVSRAGVMRSIVLAILKGWGEEGRGPVYGVGGLRQTQVDVAWMRGEIGRMLGEDREVDVLLDEVLTGVYGRCVEARPLDAARVNVLASLGEGGLNRE